MTGVLVWVLHHGGDSHKLLLQILLVCIFIVLRFCGLATFGYRFDSAADMLPVTGLRPVKSVEYSTLVSVYWVTSLRPVTSVVYTTMGSQV